MKRLKLLLLKIEYRLNYHIGPFMVNERKYSAYLSDLIRMQKEIEILEREIKHYSK